MTLQIDLERAIGERDHLAKMLRKEQDKNEALREQTRELAEALTGMLAIEDSTTQGRERELRSVNIPLARAAIAKAKGEKHEPR